MDFNNQENNQNVEVQQETVQQEAVQVENVAPVYNAVPPTYVPEQPANPNNGMAIGSLVCGIIGILCCCCCGIGVIIGIVAIVLAILSKKQNGGKLSGLAMAGLICGIAAIVFGVGYLIYYFVVGGSVLAELENMGYYY